MSNSRILYLFTRTPLHVGAGSSVGAIDQPIQRERHTGFPTIPGSSLKGVLRDTAARDDEFKAHVDAIFGVQDNAGRVSIGEAGVDQARCAGAQDLHGDIREKSKDGLHERRSLPASCLKVQAVGKVRG